MEGSQNTGNRELESGSSEGSGGSQPGTGELKALIGLNCTTSSVGSEEKLDHMGYRRKASN